MTRTRSAYRAPGRGSAGRHSRRFSTAVVLGVSFAVLLMVFSLLGRMQLTAVNDGLSAETARIRMLEQEQDKLQIAYRGTVDLAAVEQYAVDELGMTRQIPEQQAAAEDLTPDKATVLKTEGAAAFAEWTEAWVEGLAEYFS